MNARDAYVVDGVHGVAHGFSSDFRFFSYGQITGTGAYHSNSSLP